MARLEGGSSTVPPPAGGANGSSALDNLTRKVNEMRVNVNTARPNGPNDGQYGRGRGRGGGFGGYRSTKVEVPDAEFDFASANAKFNKEDVVKEGIAGGEAEAPAAEADAADDGSAAGTAGGEADAGDVPVAYSKTRSFFDNISSEAKDRAAANGQRAGGREWRGEEQRKNMETFGQGSVDGGSYRGYRGRGRGRGRGYGRGRGGNQTGYRRNDYNNEQVPQQ